MKIFVIGATGRMGQEIRKLIEQSKDLTWAGGLGQKAQAKEKIYADFADVKGGADVAIDFSQPEVLPEVVAWCESKKIPLVSGTTGLDKKQKDLLKRAGKKIPVLWSPNTAPGVQVVKSILQNLKLPDGFDAQITEHHHKHKKDKPSGTAIALQDLLVKRQPAPPPLSIRGGGIFGIHTIELMGEDEVITIEHKALGRGLFARGALDIARWLKKQKPGLYTMEDFLQGL